LEDVLVEDSCYNGAWAKVRSTGTTYYAVGLG
jgi:hypothetical protein